MAFVPDDAFERRWMDKLTPAAWTVYEAHCKYRNHKRGLSRGKKERISAEFHLALGTVRNATTELRQKGWIEETGEDVRLCVGDFSPVDKRAAAAETKRREIPDLVNPVPELMNEIPESVKDFHQNRNSHNKDRARGSTSQANQQRQPAKRKSPALLARRGEPIIPDWLPPESWKDWLHHRQEINHPVTLSQAKAQLKRLEEFRARGMSPDAVIEQSIAGGWQGLFELKGNSNGYGNGRQSNSSGTSGGRSGQARTPPQPYQQRAVKNRISG